MPTRTRVRQSGSKSAYGYGGAWLKSWFAPPAPSASAGTGGSSYSQPYSPTDFISPILRAGGSVLGQNADGSEVYVQIGGNGYAINSQTGAARQFNIASVIAAQNAGNPGVTTPSVVGPSGVTAPPPGGAGATTPPPATGTTAPTSRVGQTVSATLADGTVVSGTITSEQNGQTVVNWADGTVATYNEQGTLVSANKPATTPPVDPNAPPVDPNAPPVDPNAPPVVDPNAVPSTAPPATTGMTNPDISAISPGTQPGDVPVTSATTSVAAPAPAAPTPSGTPLPQPAPAPSLPIDTTVAGPVAAANTGGGLGNAGLTSDIQPQAQPMTAPLAAPAPATDTGQISTPWGWMTIAQLEALSLPTPTASVAPPPTPGVAAPTYAPPAPPTGNNSYLTSGMGDYSPPTAPLAPTEASAGPTLLA